jgi:protein TonB
MQRLARAPGLVAVVALHTAALAALLHYAPLREAARASAEPIMVSLVTSLAVATPAAKPPADPPPPVPRPARRPPAPKPIIAAPVEAPATLAAPAPPPDATPPQPAAQPAHPAEPAQAVAAVAPLPVIPPSFNADYLHNPAPPYPPLARRMSEEGRVVLRVLVTAEGAAERVELRTSSGSARLDDAALATVKRWKFVPARQGDRPIAAWVLIPISFSLKG